MANLRDGSYHKDGIHKKAPFLADLLIFNLPTKDSDAHKSVSF